jgi:hypothetical protein
MGSGNTELLESSKVKQLHRLVVDGILNSWSGYLLLHITYVSHLYIFYIY